MKNYNGWENRETWLVNLHFEINSKDDLEYVKNHIEEMEEEISNKYPFISDYLDFSLINWSELDAHIEEEEMENEY